MNNPISDIIYCQNMTLVTLPNLQSDSKIFAEILTAIAENGINADMISQTIRYKLFKLADVIKRYSDEAAVIGRTFF